MSNNTVLVLAMGADGKNEVGIRTFEFSEAKALAGVSQGC